MERAQLSTLERIDRKVLLHKLNNNYKISSWLHFKFEEGDDGVIVLHVFMGKKNSGVYNRCYSYYVAPKYIDELLSYDSMGRAYNRVVKHRMTRCGYFEGFWKRSDLPKTSFQL